MTLTPASRAVHCTVEFIKQRGFPHTLDDLSPEDLPSFLNKNYGINYPWNQLEIQVLWEELQELESKNEIREAMVKAREISPSDHGKFLISQEPAVLGESRTTYPLVYEYPVDKNMRLARRQKGVLFTGVQKKPSRRGDFRRYE